jgi:hypothetical protein
MVVIVAATCCAPCLLVVTFMVASCWLSGGDVESSVSVTSTRAHTLTKKKKSLFKPVTTTWPLKERRNTTKEAVC